MVNRCHSSFVHYNQIMQNHYSKHNCCGGGCGSIFTSHHHCGGGGFWGGVGAGLGLGFSNLLMGGIGMLGNWLMGGMGFGNFGMGFGNFGIGFGNGFGNFGFGNFGFGNTGFWGLNGTEKNGNKKDKIDKNKTEKDKTEKDAPAEVKTEVKTVTVEKKVDKPNADAQKITDLQTRLTGLLAKINKNETVTQQEIDKLLEDVNAIKDTDLDGIQDDIDKTNLKNLKESLATLKPNNTDKNPDEKKETTSNDKPAVKKVVSGKTATSGNTNGDAKVDNNKKTSYTGAASCVSSRTIRVYTENDYEEFDISKVTGEMKITRVVDLEGHKKGVKDIYDEEHQACVGTRYQNSRGFILFKDPKIEEAIEYVAIDAKTNKAGKIYKDSKTGQEYKLMKLKGKDEYHLVQYAGMQGSGEAAYPTNQ